ncbi:lysylphosphatidylglycerol synthase domain-containing protein [Amnibacterium sp. CER49]|uniref:lysylphosphatidylglycerol synthase domain-containing protein n=1 Tax=Amnibacterium sp. CER49 TaxID=3039161 RepID=UPI00244CEE14|nr:lysylphosphatidylglycerol synthase domain-containing protein [Amnibacterium sp. CER49]MDH2443759.1 lysylphosphatidylglycerol synthase domain-containing protein [Amnibacterium sp. CER49]
MSAGCRAALRWAIRGAGVAVLALLLVRVGAAPFVDGLRRLTGPVVLAAVAATALTTLLSALRWQALGRLLGTPLPLDAAFAAYYRSQLLNTVLPGGVTGDVERALRRAPAGERLRRLRVVAWDRGAGQAVQLVLLAAALPALPPPVRLPGWIVLLAVAALVAAALAACGGRAPTAGPARLLRTDLRRLARRPVVLALVIVLSVAVALLHAGVLVLAAVATGAPPDPGRLLPLAVAVQVAMAVPIGFGGLGAREGAAAVVFAAAGLGTAAGVSAGVAYGALALIAVLPGIVPLLTPAARRLPVRRARSGAAR